MNDTDITSLVDSSNIDELVKEAVPFRMQIIETFNPRMKELKDSFVQEMIKVNYLGIADILKQLKNDKRNEALKADRAKAMKKINQIFKMTLKCIHPNNNADGEPVVPNLKMLHTAGPMLKYLGRQAIIDAAIDAHGIRIDIADTFNNDEAFAGEDTHVSLEHIFNEADKTQGEICSRADSIKITTFDKLDPSVAFSKDNKAGIKSSQFNQLVTNKAMSFVKDAEKFTKYMELKRSGNKDDIVRNKIILKENENI